RRRPPRRARPATGVTRPAVGWVERSETHQKKAGHGNTKKILTAAYAEGRRGVGAPRSAEEDGPKISSPPTSPKPPRISAYSAVKMSSSSVAGIYASAGKT